ncbi:MAG: Two-component transcriptional response regulator, LuxR family [uncultured Rubrobacteraceae bacterium]|uniref:Two-component transcriptional response regulator, LuxR family n=1 Tax=uncultured Rubrobacteraceae bacterium TaxID=349277 RepID=A0A6J4R047_9ACTN|nr:MAG: Two-component transcriptional response regulator, LuxR family [uncultured Rubrobacteraceae bacterium]
MREAKLHTTLLLADDDPDDRLLIKEALEESRLVADLRSVEDGEELMDYLHRRGRYAESSASPHPDLILLDLKMPRKSGHQALEEIKATPELRCIPIVVLTTSKAEEDIARAYASGANSFIVKPTSFGTLIEAMKTLRGYWFELITLPPGRIGR